ncbi:MAG: arginase family protein, partial [Proteobacteria bacterium]|nr:arginase family protein [Pseudomonadota bacterium]
MIHFLAGEIPNAQPGQAAFHVIPAPLESSVSYGSGTALGPAAVLQASTQLELWDGSS